MLEAYAKVTAPCGTRKLLVLTPGVTGKLEGTELLLVCRQSTNLFWFFRSIN